MDKEILAKNDRIVRALIAANPPDLVDRMVDLSWLCATASMYDESTRQIEALAREFRRQLGRE